MVEAAIKEKESGKVGKWLDETNSCLLCLDHRLLVEIFLSGLVAEKSEVIKFVVTKIPV